MELLIYVTESIVPTPNGVLTSSKARHLFTIGKQKCRQMLTVDELYAFCGLFIDAEITTNFFQILVTVSVFRFEER